MKRKRSDGDPFIAKVEATIRERGLLPRGKTIGVAVSGGADSVALLAALAEIAPRWKCKLAVLHVNHALRGRESGGDQRFVRDLAARFQLPFRFANLGENPSYRKILQMGRPSEAFLRFQRYCALELLADDAHAGCIALAHHRDDQAETVLMHLLRGSGPSGLGGFRATSRFVLTTLIRPLYDCTRAEILEFLNRRGLTWREDQTNRDRRWLRNRIRHELLPMLEREYNPQLRELLADNARWFQADEQHFEQRARKTLGWKSERGRAPQSLSLQTLRALDLALLARVLRLWVMAATGQSHPPPAQQIDDLARLIHRPNRTAQVRCAGGITYYIEGGQLRCWRPAIPGQSFFRPEKDESSGAGKDIPPLIRLKEATPLPEAGTFALGEARLDGPRKRRAKQLASIVVEIRLFARQRHPKRFQQARARALCATASTALEQHFDADQIKGPLVLRNRRPGDRFYPLGAPGERKLKEVLIDHKVPAEWRDRLVLLCDAQKVLWIVGLRTAHAARLTDAAENILRVRVEPR